MRLAKTLTVISLLLVLPACSASTNFVSPPAPPRISAPDSALVKDCKLPIDIGSKALTQSQLESLWITDRISLLDCARRHKALRDFIADRDAGLGKK